VLIHNFFLSKLNNTKAQDFLSWLKATEKDLRRPIILEGKIPNSIEAIPKNSVDIVFANNIIEHLENPLQLIKEFKRITKSESLIYINVPSWTGKIFLELAAFRFHLASRIEMQDHKNYYDRKSLWTLVRKSGFMPSQITIRKTKFGLNITCWINNAE
jgi:SAM-dependent methyltransferase